MTRSKTRGESGTPELTELTEYQIDTSPQRQQGKERSKKKEVSFSAQRKERKKMRITIGTNALESAVLESDEKIIQKVYGKIYVFCGYPGAGKDRPLDGNIDDH
jgi:hypothetical protein